ncbi:MAG: hypothetical protein Q8835_03160, partial [Sweet potato little leaf phytoplasma]|nr:hypothetical protein [Sweet potato little leaf phytoplasma]
MTKYGYNVKYSKVWDGKRKAIHNIFGDWDESYQLLPSWTNILQLTNPGTRVAWRLHDVVENINENEVVENSNEKIFHSVFWAFGPVIEGFKHCRPLLQIDGTHLYG